MTDAAEYVRAGLALVSIPKGKKGPVSRGWNKRGNAITDAQRAAELSGNIGLAHAYSGPPTMALDIDDLPKARLWLSERGVDLDALLEADDAVQVSSGRQGRAKLLYRLPYGLHRIESVTIKKKDNEGRDLTTLEFRCATRDGLTLQDVLPPSTHPITGQPYRWAGRGHWSAIPAIPTTLLSVWRAEFAARNTCDRGKGRLPLFKGVDDTPRRRARVAEMLRHVSPDCSYELYRDIVWAILSLGWNDAEAIAKHWCRAAPHRFEEPCFHSVVASYDDTRTPTIGTIHYHAKAGGWNG